MKKRCVSSVISLALAAVMLLSGLPLTPFMRFLPQTALIAQAADGTDLNIDFDYATNNHIGSAEDALTALGNEGMNANQSVAVDYYKSNYNKFRWKAVTYDDVTVKDVKDGSLRQLLTSTNDEDTYVVLTKDLSTSYCGNTVYQTMTVTRNKVLDLNGHTINLMYGSNRNNKDWDEVHYKQTKHAEYHNSVFITVENGATLTIIDSSMWTRGGASGGGTGGIKFHAYMVSPHYSEMKYYTTRDLFHVNNGNLVIYGGTYQAGRQKDQLKDNFTWDKLKTVIGTAVSLGVSVASYATGIQGAKATAADVNETVMNERANSAEYDNETEPTATSTAKKDGSGAKPEKMASTPDQAGNDATGAGRNQTIGEKKQTNNDKNAADKEKGTGTEKPTDEKNKSNSDNTAKQNGSTKGVDYASRLAKAEKGVVDSIVNKDGIMGMVDGVFNFVDGVAGMFGQDETSRVTQSIMGTVVKCGNMGTFVSYGGTYKGYGSTPNTRNAVVEIVRSNNNDNPAVPNRYNGGQAYIFGGTFEAYTGANVFNMVRANSVQQREQVTRGTDGKITVKTVTLPVQETNGMEQVYFENQEAVAHATDDKPVEPILVNTRNVMVRGGTFRCYYEVMNMGIADSTGTGEGKFVKFPGTPGSVNLGIESFGRDFIRDGRVQIVDNYGDGALVLMDEEKDDVGARTGVYHYRLFCSDEELRYKSYLTVYPNTARTNSTYSMRLETYYGEGEQQDISKAWETDNDNTRDAAFANDEKYFAFPLDNPWTANTYYVTPKLENTDPEGAKLDSSEVWYYTVPVSTKGDPIGTFAYGNVTIRGKKNGSDVTLFDNKYSESYITDYLNGMTNVSATQTTFDSYRQNMKWFRYRLYRVDPLTKASISESKTFGSDVPLAEVVYGAAENQALRCILNLKDMEAQLKDKATLRDGTKWQGYKQGELYRIVFDVEEYLTYGFIGAGASQGRLDVAKAVTSVMFACYSVNEKQAGELHEIEDYTPLQWVASPEVGKTASISILNGFAGKVDYEQNANKIFDVYYQWYECDENGKNARLIAGTDNIYKGHEGWTWSQTLAEKRYHTPDKWFKSDGTVYTNPATGKPYQYLNTIDPKDPNIGNLDQTTGLPKDVLQWRADQIHAYTREICGKDMTMLAADKSQRVTRQNNDVFATNTDSVYIPKSLTGKYICVKCVAVNVKWTAAYDRIQTFWSHPVKVTSSENVLSYVAGLEATGSVGEHSVKPGTEITLRNNFFKPTDKSLAFTGWKIGSKVYQPGDTYKVTADAVATAQWKTANIKITFSASGSTGTVPSPITADYGQTVTLPSPTLVSGSNPGWTLARWRIINSYYEPGSKYTVQSKTDLVAYATYRASVVSFNANGGSGSMASYTMQASDNGDYTLPVCTITPPAGKTFDKWDRGAPGDVIQIRGDTVLKPVWRTAKMTFKPGIGSGTMSPIYATAKGFTLPACTFTAPMGKTFLLYAIYRVNADGTTTYLRTALPGELVKINGDAEAIAGWYVKPSEFFTLTWNANGGVGTAPETVRIPNGTAVERTYTFPDLALDPPEGSYFLCYEASTVGLSTTYTYRRQPGETLTVSSDLTIKPIWSSVYYNVSFVNAPYVIGPDGKKFYPEADPATLPPKQKVPSKNAKVTVPEVVLTAPGYTFDGWDFDFSQTEFTKDVSVPAKWTVNEYEVNIVAGEHGTVSWVKAYTNQRKILETYRTYAEAETANLDDHVRLLIHPEVGYVVDQVNVVRQDTGAVEGLYGYNLNDDYEAETVRGFYMNAANVTVYVTFRPRTYAVKRVYEGTSEFYGRAAASFNGRAEPGEEILLKVWSSREEYEESIHETSEKTINLYPNAGCKYTGVDLIVDGVRTDLSETMRFTMPEKEVTLCPHFETTEVYYYTVYVESDFNGTASCDKPIADVGDVVTLSVEPNPGYRFAYWTARDYYRLAEEITFTDDEGQSVTMSFVDLLDIRNNQFTYREGDWYHLDLNKIVVTAHFEPIPALHVSFGANGGKGNMPAVESLPGEDVTLPECNFAPDGCKVFVGWKIGSKTYQPGENVKLSDDATAIAQWMDVDHVAVPGDIITPATCTKNGLRKLVCRICGEDLGTRAIPAAHDTVYVELLEPTCIAAGHTESEYCAVCGEVFKEQTSIPKRTDHTPTPGDWIVDTPATETAEGVKHKECAVCGAVLETQAIPRTGSVDYTLGDVDGKDGVTAADARLALRAAVGLESYAPGSREFLAADVDVSGTLTAADARLILRHAVKLKDAEWGGKP